MSGRFRTVFTLLLGIPAALLFLFSILRPIAGEAGRFLDPVLSATCHRLPSRCLGTPLGITGLCARCTSFWLGLALGCGILHYRYFRVPFSVGLLLLLPLVADGSLQYFSGYESFNYLRVITGLSAGLGIAAVFLGKNKG